jgi:cation transport ATPase
MHSTAPRPVGLSQQEADQTRSNHLSVVEQDSYGEERTKRLRRGRLVGFALCIPLWALSVVPLAREFTDGRSGAALVLVFLAAAAFSLAVAVAIRGVYVLLMRRRFWSPWLFPLAAFVAIAGYTVQSAGAEDITFEGAPAGVLEEMAEEKTLSTSSS